MWQGSSFSELDRIFLSGLLVFRNAPNVPGVEIPVSLSHWRSSEVQLVVGFSAWIVTELHLLHQCDTALGLRWSHSSHCEASTTISQLWHDEPLNTRWHLHLQRSDISLVGVILRQKPPQLWETISGLSDWWKDQPEKHLRLWRWWRVHWWRLNLWS